MTTARRIAALGLVLGIGATSAAQAEPNRTQPFAGSGTFAWDASGSGIVAFSDGTVPVDQCTAGLRACDDTLFKLEAPGVLTATVKGADPLLYDVAIDLFESDATGAATTLIAHGDANFGEASQAAGETVTGDLAPGFYLVRTDFLIGDGTAQVEANFVAAPVAAPAPPAPVAPAKPAATIKKASASGVSGSAVAGAGVARVDVGVTKGSGSKCQAMTSSGSFKKTKRCSAPSLIKAKGTDGWALKFRKKLKKGTYTVHVRVTDKAGATSVKRKRLRVK